MTHSFWLFLYSRRNICGSLLALCGLVLHLFGWLKLFWIPIVAGLYALGFITMPSERKTRVTIQPDLSFQDLHRQLGGLVKRHQKALPDQAYESLQAILSAFDTLSTRIEEHNHSHLDRTLRRMAESYIPDSLLAYTRLPTAYANLHILQDNKTAKQLLIEQLALLNQQVTRLEVDFFEQDAKHLLAHGRLLDELFDDHATLF